MLAVVFVGLASVFLWQYDNIMALYRGITETEESLRQKIQENQRLIDDTLKKYQDINVRDLTEDEIGSLLDGSLTEQEIIDKIIKKDQSAEKQEHPVGQENPGTGATAESPAADSKEGKTDPAEEKPSPQGTTSSTKPGTGTDGGKANTNANAGTDTNGNTSTSTNASASPSDDLTEVNNRISLLIARMYVLKAKFTQALKTLENTVKEEYLALPESERTSSAKRSITSKALYQVAGLEEECDAEVNKVVEEIEDLLKSSGQDLSLTEAIRVAYKKEKENTKAYYVNRYLK